MAQEAGAIDVHAKYGLGAQNTEAYATLRRVTHWTKADVDREKRIHAGGEVLPRFVLEEGLQQLLEVVEFEELEGGHDG